MTKQKEKLKTREWIMLVIIIFLLLLLLLVVILFGMRSHPNETPSSASASSVPVESNAQSIPGASSGEKLDQPEGGGAVTVNYSGNVNVSVSAGTAALYVANPPESNQDFAFTVLVGDTEVLRSGRLQPGNEVRALELDNTDIPLEPGTYAASMLIHCYDTASGEMADMETVMAITVTIEK